MQTIDRVAELMVTLDEFSDLLDVENAAIRVADADTIEKLSTRKQFLAMHYQRQMRMLADRRLEVAELDPKIRRHVGDLWQKFNQKMIANVEALKVAQDSTRHVVAIIVDAIRNAQSGGGRDAFPVAYRDSGASATALDSACVSVTYNRVL